MSSPSAHQKSPKTLPEFESHSPPQIQTGFPNEFTISPIRALSTPSPPIEIEIETLPSPVADAGDNGLPFQGYEDKENGFDFETDLEVGEDAFHLHPHYENQKRFCSTPSPHRCHTAGSNDGMRHHLLVQRTLNHHEVDCLGPLTSSPMRKVPVIASPGGLTPSMSKYTNKESCSDGYSHNIGVTPQFKTPIRGQRENHLDRDHNAWERTPSAPRTPAGFMSPASSLYAFSTPGRQYVNPFESDHDRLHFPNLTPSMFQVKQKDVESSAEKEGFWSVEQRAMLMPIEIKESEILRQHYYQTKRAKELDPIMQKAVDRFFSNELIVPSPWSDQKSVRSTGGFRQTPTSAKTPAIARSVSCQTSMSVPPDVDLMEELGDKYQLGDDQLVRESPVDSSLAGCFIRRKLLHQLNENDDSVTAGASPELPTRTQSLGEDVTASTSPSPTKQVTPEIDKQTPNKKSSGHFSSSPIRPAGDRGNHPAMSESDLLASPELSPIAGRGSNKPLRSSDMFTPRQEFERSREIMQLDFSSILDEPDDFDNPNVSHKTGTLIQTKEEGNFGVGSIGLCDNHATDGQQQGLTGSSANNCDNDAMCGNEEAVLLSSAASSLSHHNSCNSGSNININKSLNDTLRKSLIMSGLSAEWSANDILPSNVANLLSSQDTGYQTASLQSITNLDSASNSNPQSQLQDIHSSSVLSSCSSANHSLMMMSSSTSSINAQSKVLLPSSSVDLTTCNKPSSSTHGNCVKDLNTLHTSFTNKYTGIIPNTHSHKSDLCAGDEGNSLDSYLSSGTRLSYLFSDNDNDLDFYSNSFTKGHNNCRVRKIRTLADVRRTREKSNASRDLTSSFNEEARSASTVIVRLSRSLSNPSINMDSATSSAVGDSLTTANAVVSGDDDKGHTKCNLHSPITEQDFSSKGNLEKVSNQKLNCLNSVGVGSLRSASSSLEKRPFENIGAVTESGGLSVDVCEDDSDAQNSNKFIKLLGDDRGKEYRLKGEKDSIALFSSPPKSGIDQLRPIFSLELEDKNTLNKARELLGKSEALRQQHDCDGNQHQLEMDTFYQFISDHTGQGKPRSMAPHTGLQVQYDELQRGKDNAGVGGRMNDHQCDKLQDMGYDVGATGLSSMKSIHPVRSSSPDDAMFETAVVEEELVDDVNVVGEQDIKLGSEIAAEILKRAGEDLAQFTTLVDGSSNTNSDSNSSCNPNISPSSSCHP